ncbi:hypothetical protein SRS16CHR_03154 [Variovorax sp. SRS16]|nr:hypothetical protein SRS16CHR_03154 [Variovorax sp. SRS16]
MKALAPPLRQIHLHQIFYDEATRAALDPGFVPMDNLANARPDWFEYWSIRRFFLGTVLNENDLYGFFSPKFRTKTGLSAEAVRQFVGDGTASRADVYLFSPVWGAACYFRNVFEQGERFHPGLLPVSQAFFDAAGWRVDLRQLVMSTRTTVFCNYFVATPRFWRRWFEVGEALFRIAEDPDHPLARHLVTFTAHNPAANIYQFKAFLQERIASFLLCVEDWNTVACDFSALPDPLWPAHLQRDLLVLDALKMSYVDTGLRLFIDEFDRRRSGS